MRSTRHKKPHPSQHWRTTRQLVVLASLGSLLSACALTSPDQRLQATTNLVAQAGWQTVPINSQPFALMAYANPALQYSAVLRVYIEGDGLAWIDPQTPSFDPTPLHATGLALAMRDPASHVVYLGRPCQYVRGAARQGCSTRWWTSHRFASEVMASTHTALDALKQRYHAQTIELVGYSGGATVAAVMAAQRQDVSRLVTVAGNLDPEFWIKLHGFSPLQDVQNPITMVKQLQDIPQVHFTGLKDTIITPAVTAHFLNRFPTSPERKWIKLVSFDHACCWENVWPSLLMQAFLQPDTPASALKVSP